MSARSPSTAPFVRLPSHALQLKPEDDKLWQRIRPLLGGAERFRPPRVGDIAERASAPEAAVRRLLKLLGRVATGRRDRAGPFLPAHHRRRDGRDRKRHRAERTRPQLTAAQFRDRLDNGRKVAIQILEFLDRHGVTLRNGDLRRMNRASSTCSATRQQRHRRPCNRNQANQEENCPRWDVRTSNPGGAVSRSLVGSTPTLFRQPRRRARRDRALRQTREDPPRSPGRTPDQPLPPPGCDLDRHERVESARSMRARIGTDRRERQQRRQHRGRRVKRHPRRGEMAARVVAQLGERRAQLRGRRMRSRRRSAPWRPEGLERQEQLSARGVQANASQKSGEAWAQARIAGERGDLPLRAGRQDLRGQRITLAATSSA